MTSPYSVDARFVVWMQRLVVLLDGLVILVFTYLFLKRATKPMVELVDAV